MLRDIFQQLDLGIVIRERISDTNSLRKPVAFPEECADGNDSSYSISEIAARKSAEEVVIGLPLRRAVSITIHRQIVPAVGIAVIEVGILPSEAGTRGNLYIWPEIVDDIIPEKPHLNTQMYRHHHEKIVLVRYDATTEECREYCLAFMFARPDLNFYEGRN